MPTVDVATVWRWLKPSDPSPPADGSNELAILEDVLAATVATIGGRCVYLGDTDPEDGTQAPPAEWPPQVAQAAVMATARLYRRRTTPEGIAEFPDLGITTIRRYDPDVESMLGPFLRIGFA